MSEVDDDPCVPYATGAFILQVETAGGALQ